MDDVNRREDLAGVHRRLDELTEAMEALLQQRPVTPVTRDGAENDNDDNPFGPFAEAARGWTRERHTMGVGVPYGYSRVSRERECGGVPRLDHGGGRSARLQGGSRRSACTPRHHPVSWPSCRMVDSDKDSTCSDGEGKTSVVG